MSFAGQRDGKPLFHLPSQAGPDDHAGSWLSGDAVVSLSPISLLAGVLGRVARALAARARFSLDRFSDVYLVTDAIAAHAGRAAKGARLSFAISTAAQRLELTIGPFVDGSGGQLSRTPRTTAPRRRWPSSAMNSRSDARGRRDPVCRDDRPSPTLGGLADHSSVSSSSGASTSVSLSPTPVRLSSR